MAFYRHGIHKNTMIASTRHGTCMSKRMSIMFVMSNLGPQCSWLTGVHRLGTYGSNAYFSVFNQASSDTILTTRPPTLHVNGKE